MRDEASSQGWELEDSADIEDRWVLEESEQQLGDEWDLEGTPEPVGQWQPVEYDKPRGGGPAWILPTVVTIALLAVLGYSAVTLVPELLVTLRDQVLGATAAPTGENMPTEEVAAAATEPAGEVAPTEEPTLTPVPSDTPTEVPPTPAPTETLAAAQQLFARVLSEYGVNARSGPGVEYDVLQILEPEATFVVLDKVDDDWLQLFISEGPLEAGQPVSGIVGYASAEFLSEAMQPFSEELWLQVLDAAGIAPTATPVPPTPEGGEAAAGDASLPTVTPGVEAGETLTETVAAEPSNVTVLIDAINGLNVRTSPELNADIVTLLADQSEVPAIGRYATNEWILVDLGDGATGWVFTELVQLDGDLASLPAVTLGELAPPTPTPEDTPTPEPTPVTAPPEPPAPYSSSLPAGVPGALVFSASGVNARELPNASSAVITVIPENAALPVVARTSNGDWLQVELPEGGFAWIVRAAVIPRGDLTTVPFSDGTEEIVPPAEEPVPEEVVAEPTVAPTEAPAAQPEEQPAEPAEPVEPVDEGAEPAVGATVVMRKVVVPVFDTPSADGTKIVQYGRGTVIPATGRTADGAWIQVLATTGDAGWVAAKSVDTSVEAASLPVIE